MLINISTTHYPATDLGYLLHKHPDKYQVVDLSIGKAHIFYPEKSDERTTISLLLDIDAIEMIRNSKNAGNQNFALEHYVNDRPYVISSLMSTALTKSFSTAMSGRCKDKPELVDKALPLEALLAVIPVLKGGEALVRRLFEPLGYEVTVKQLMLDEQFPDWGMSKYFTIQLKNTITIQHFLNQLFVLIPVLDQSKHYYVGKEEIEKLMRKGIGWLNEHPAKDEIVKRYFIKSGALSRQALERLEEVEGDSAAEQPQEEPALVRQRRESLHDKRLQAAEDQLLASGAQRVLDLGCGEGKLLRRLLKYGQFTEILGMDVSYDELLKAKNRLHYDDLSPKQKDRIQLIQGSLTYRDKRLEGYDAAAVIEVIEHLELERLKAFERVLFEFIHPKTIVLTTPNQEFNAYWESLDSDAMRHHDHRFEWTRKEFEDWAKEMAGRFGYVFEIFPVGDSVENLGSPSQMAVFTYGN